MTERLPDVRTGAVGGVYIRGDGVVGRCISLRIFVLVLLWRFSPAERPCVQSDAGHMVGVQAYETEI